MVDHVVPAAPRADPRRRHRHGRRRAPARAPNAGAGRRPRPDRGHAAARPGERAPSTAPRTAIRLVAGPAEQLPFPDAAFDALTFTYLLRYVADPAATLRELARVVKPGAPVASLEFHVPPQPLLAGLVVALHPHAPAGGGPPGGPVVVRRSGRFLGPNISEHYRRYPLSWTVDAWREAGFVDVGVRIMSLGGGARHVGPQGWLSPSGDRRSTPPAPGGWRDWWTILHPPYTAWHLSYVVVGACARPAHRRHPARRHRPRLLLRRGGRRPRPRRAPRPSAADPALRPVPCGWRRAPRLAAAVVLGIAGLPKVGLGLMPFIVMGPVLVVGLQPRAPRRTAPHRRRLRLLLGRLPDAHRVLRPGRTPRRRRALSPPPPRSASPMPSAA